MQRQILKPIQWEIGVDLTVNRGERVRYPTVFEFTGAAFNKSVKYEGGRLALQNCRSFQMNAGRRNLAGKHRPRRFPELQVMRARTDQRHVERIAVTASRSTNTLNVVRLLWRNGGKHQRREIADIDTHFERG